MTDCLGVDVSNRTCLECGAQVVGNANRKYCADICKWRAKERVRAATGYYQQEHVMQKQADYKRAKYREDISSGKASGRLLAIWQSHGAEGIHDRPITCVAPGCNCPTFARLKCRAHYEREMLAEGSYWAAERFSSSGREDYRHRAKRFGVAFEEVDKFGVFERDGWICGICAEPVSKALSYPDPMSVSLDHVIPLSRGGGHVESNVQCSHLSCNVQKGARHGEETRTGTGIAGN